MPRPWSRYSLKKEGIVTEEGKKLAGAKSSSLVESKGEKNIEKGGENDDPKLQEFLQVMQPRMKSKLWANDTLVASTAHQNVNVSEKETQDKEEHKEKSVPVHVGLHEPETSGNHVAKKSRNLAHDEVISDMDYFKSRVKQEWSDSESSEDDNHDKYDNSGSLKESLEGQVAKVDLKGSNTNYREGVLRKEVEDEDPSQDPDSEIPEPGRQSSSLKGEKEVLETRRLFVRNLPYTATYSSFIFPYCFACVCVSYPVYLIKSFFYEKLKKKRVLFCVVYEIKFFSSYFANSYF
jgi:multiple RNA-binding domain-containing protein 1